MGHSGLRLLRGGLLVLQDLKFEVVSSAQEMS